jgi:hypothetical protein
MTTGGTVATGGAGARAGSAGSTGGSGDGGLGSGGTANGGVAGATGGAGNAGGSGGNPGGRLFSIRFDYRFDTAGFFEAPERRRALEAAGAVWSRLIRDDFDTVPAGTRLRLRNPENRDEYVWVEGIEEDIDDLLVFVGSSDAIPGLGRGGPSNTAQSSDPQVQANLSARPQASDFEPWAGSISFNPTSEFFFDPTPDTADDIPAAEYDFISNALHEIGHVLGFTEIMAFNAFVDGQSFVGPTAESVYGGPVPLDESLGHFLEGTELDGIEPLMDTGQTNGKRFVPTPLDLAVLADMGYEFAP